MDVTLMCGFFKLYVSALEIDIDAAKEVITGGYLVAFIASICDGELTSNKISQR